MTGTQPHGLQIILFSPDISLFPPIKEIGDVIFIHSLKIELYGKDSILQGQSNIVKDPTLYGVFSGGVGDPVIQRAPHNPTAPLLPSNMYLNTLIEDMREKGREILPKTTTNEYACSLATIHLKDFVDVVCRIERIETISPGTYHFWVWDGTILDNNNSVLVVPILLKIV